MRTSEATLLFDHLYWIRDRVLERASALDEATWQGTATTTTRDLRATLVHELDVQWSWRERLKGADWDEWGPDAELRATDYPTVEAPAEHWRRDEADTAPGLPDSPIQTSTHRRSATTTANRCGTTSCTSSATGSSSSARQPSS